VPTANTLVENSPFSFEGLLAEYISVNGTVTNPPSQGAILYEEVLEGIFERQQSLVLVINNRLQLECTRLRLTKWNNGAISMAHGPYSSPTRCVTLIIWATMNEQQRQTKGTCTTTQSTGRLPTTLST
jgi:hypothetical protein